MGNTDNVIWVVLDYLLPIVEMGHSMTPQKNSVIGVKLELLPTISIRNSHVVGIAKHMDHTAEMASSMMPRPVMMEIGKMGMVAVISVHWKDFVHILIDKQHVIKIACVLL